jgi:hypothetical protein
VCLIEEQGGRPSKVEFIPPEKLITKPPKAEQCAQAIHTFCLEQGITIVLLDGPQGWKAPDDGLEHCRICESKLNTPMKTGTKGEVKPPSSKPFVAFSIAVFKHLVSMGGVLVSDRLITMPADGGLLVAESFPSAAWRKLYVLPLSAKRRTEDNDKRGRLHVLQKLFGFHVEGFPTHDELSALVAGMAGPAILAGNASGYIAEGEPPRNVDGVIVEGFIVNPCFELKTT